MSDYKSKQCMPLTIAHSVLMQGRGLDTIPPAPMCIGPDCAMWREGRTETPKGSQYPVDRPGYCGLAGKPEVV